eukprot:504015_1
MASENDQEFDDSQMLQLALQMSLQQPSPRPEMATTEAPNVEVPLSSAIPESAASTSNASEPTPVPEKVATVPLADSPKKKKKKKNSYANMMASVMNTEVSEEDKQKEIDDKLKRSMGGGQFSKLDKI